MTDLTAQAIEKLVSLGAMARPPIDHPAGGQALLVPEGFGVERLAPIDPPLTHIKQVAGFDDRASFCAYVQTYLRPESVIFVNLIAGTITAVIDYHAAQAPAYCAHRAIYRLPHSEQWKRWAGIDGRAMDQRAFAEFIEENIADVYQPDGATLLEIASSLQTTRKLEFHAGVNLGNGTTQFTYIEEDSPRAGKQSLTVPQKLTLGIPIYYGEEPEELLCFFRYRIADGKLQFIVRMHQRETLIRDAIRRIAAEIATATGLPVLFGELR